MIFTDWREEEYDFYMWDQEKDDWVPMRSDDIPVEEDDEEYERVAV
jgi:hypothetical protein